MLTPTETLALAPDALKLATDIRAAFDADSPGGKRLTKGEARKLGLAALMFAVALLGEVLD